MVESSRAIPEKKCSPGRTATGIGFGRGIEGGTRFRVWEEVLK